ncbi:hypothetical protein [Streptomyces sp. NBC_00096]|uniref:hypothetical protein n=1 Tax=Streptomyces sp. NBC_00096 TaxID=2975650 RepID=UPI00324AC050
MTRPAPRTARRAVRWHRLPLLATLLLGIVTMHTLGHPTRAHAMDDVPSVRFVPLAGHAPSGSAPGDSAPSGAALHGAMRDDGARAGGMRDDGARDYGTRAGGAPGAGAAAHSVPDARALAADAPRPHTGMDPMSVCLAVLGALTLLFLGAGPAGPRRAAPLGGAARASGRSGGPDPPLPRELLTLLAVLRV